jgi:hypothetical protein
VLIKKIERGLGIFTSSFVLFFRVELLVGLKILVEG